PGGVRRGRTPFRRHRRARDHGADRTAGARRGEHPGGGRLGAGLGRAGGGVMLRHRIDLSAFDGVTPFAPYDGRALGPLAPHVDRLAVMPGVALASEGRRAREVLFIIAGEVLVLRDGEQIDRLGPGAIIGARQEVSGTPHDATYVAGTGVAALARPARPLRGPLPPLH